MKQSADELKGKQSNLQNIVKVNALVNKLKQSTDLLEKLDKDDLEPANRISVRIQLGLNHSVLEAFANQQCDVCGFCHESVVTKTNLGSFCYEHLRWKHD